MTLKRQYTIPLRRAWQQTERYRRSKTAVRALKQFLAKHMKSEDIKLGEHLNEKVWSQGSKRPPAKVSVNVEKNDEGRVFAELEGYPMPSELAAAEEQEEKPTKKAKKVVAPKAEKVEAKAEEKPAKVEQKAPVKKPASDAKPATE